MKTIQDEMFAMIENEIINTLELESEKYAIEQQTAIKVAKGLVDLSIGNGQPEGLSNDYIAIIESVCKQQNK